MQVDIGNASPEVVAEIKRDVNILEKQLQGARDGSGIGLALDRSDFDAGDLKHELSEKKRWLNTWTPQKLTGEEANKAYSRAKELQLRIADKIQGAKSFYQLYPKDKSSHKKTQDFKRAVDHEEKLLKDKDYKRDVTEYRNLMRQLDPDDPGATSLEGLRSGKNVRIRR